MMYKRRKESYGLYLASLCRNDRSLNNMNDPLYHIFAKLLLQLFLLGSLLVGCTNHYWKPPNTGSVMVELKSPDNCIYARVIATEIPGTYKFEVRHIQSDQVLEEKNISAPIGYHPYLVTLVWDQDGRSVWATIDHDFGDGNKTYDLNVLKFDG